MAGPLIPEGDGQMGSATKRKCAKCKKFKSVNSFNKCSARKGGLQSYCKECQSAAKRKHYSDNHEAQKAYSRAYSKANPERMRRRNANYRANNPDKIKAWRQAFRRRHPERVKEWDRKYRAENSSRLTAQFLKRRNEDIQFRMACNLRTRVNQAIKKNQKAGSAVEDLGCSIADFIRLIEYQFRGDMNWDNWGQHWELDHIFPLAKVNLKSRVEFLAACNFRNYQPLTVKENAEKGDAVTAASTRLFLKLVREFVDAPVQRRRLIEQISKRIAQATNGG